MENKYELLLVEYRERIEKLMQDISDRRSPIEIKAETKALKNELKQRRDLHESFADAYHHLPNLNSHPYNSDWYEKFYNANISIEYGISQG